MKSGRQCLRCTSQQTETLSVPRRTAQATLLYCDSTLTATPLEHLRAPSSGKNASGLHFIRLSVEKQSGEHLKLTEIPIPIRR